MLLLVEISVVVASLAVVVIAVAAVRAMRCVEKSADQVSGLIPDLRQWISQANELTREARETVASAREVIVPIRRVVDRFEPLGERAAGLSAAVLEGVEVPLQTAVAVAGVMRSVTAYFLKRWSHRITHGRSATLGGHDSEQRPTDG